MCKNCTVCRKNRAAKRQGYACMFPSLLFSLSTPRAWVPPAVAPASMLLGVKVNNIFCCDRNMPRIFCRRFYTRSDTACIEVFIHRQNQIRFHNRFLFSIRGYGCDEKSTPPELAFALQKLSRLPDNFRLTIQRDFAKEAPDTK